MIRIKQMCLPVVAVLTLLSLSAGSRAADLELGKVLYGTCGACHGIDAAGIDAMNGPALAGQDSAYLIRQLQHFKSGVRGEDPRDALGKQMQGMAATLADDAAVENVVAYITSLPMPASSQTIEHDQRNGEVQYNASCGACHGPGGKGNASMNAPRLAGLGQTYLRRQYNNFALGIRGSHPDDRYGRQMQMMATMLSTDKDLDDVIGYLLSQ
ncbi:c-type cytochrome [Congregibacter variabilis]|uniref:C-type cytochrome n=1 Tax=Congregibacter variabilis TaxID=3081200 RepID=A0ABZ0HYF0_9GAMM|nr:c-type cytochrome [Congregibacter sp. IMCC43200]